MITSRLHRLLALALFSGCADANDEPEAAESRVPAVASDASAASSDLAASEPALDEWQAWLSGELARAEQQRPAAVAELRAVAPVATRAGHPRFTDEALGQPGAAAVLLDRLSRGKDPAPVRAALAEALPRAGGAYGAALVGVMAGEKDPEVRVAMVSALRRAAPGPALAGLRAGLADADARVRAAAAEVAARRPDGGELADPLIGLLDDASAEVQVVATRSLGALAIAAAFPALQARLRDLSPGTAELRLHSLRALGRIDAPRAAGLAEVRALRDDRDPRVAEAAGRVSAGKR